MSPGRSKPKEGVPRFDGECTLCGKSGFVDALQYRNHVYGVHRDSEDNGWEDELRRAQESLTQGEERFFVYVVELEDEYSKQAFYVGMTRYPPIQRFLQHKNGEYSNSHVEKRGVRLRPDLNPTQELPLVQEEAEEMEVRTREHLEDEGYRVFGAKRKGYYLDFGD